MYAIYHIIYILPSATWTHKFVGLFQKPGFSMHVAKKPGLSQKKTFFFFRSIGHYIWFQRLLMATFWDLVWNDDPLLSC